MTYTRMIDKVLHTESSNLVACWARCGESGAVLYDFARFGPYNGVIAGGVTPSATRTPGYDFDSVDGRIDVYSATNPSILLNGGFETAGAMPPTFLNWVDVLGDGAIANEGVIVHEGADAAKLTAGLTSNTAVVGTITVVTGKRYRLRFWTRGDGTYDGRYQLWDNDNAGSIFTALTGVAGATYLAVVKEFTVPAGCTSIDLYFKCPTTNGGIAYFDACEVRSMDGFLPDQGAAIVFCKTDAAWDEGIERYALHLYTDVVQNIHFRKMAGAGVFRVGYRAHVVDLNAGAMTSLDFFCAGLTWDCTVTDTMQTYLNGVPDGGGVTLAPWVGELSIATIGASSTVPADVWNGGIGLIALYNEFKDDAEMLDLSTP